MSVALPAACGTMKRIARSGYSARAPDRQRDGEQHQSETKAAHAFLPGFSATVEHFGRACLRRYDAARSASTSARSSGVTVGLTPNHSENPRTA